MDEKLCEVKHKRVDERIGTIDVRRKHGAVDRQPGEIPGTSNKAIKNVIRCGRGPVKVLWVLGFPGSYKHGRFLYLVCQNRRQSDEMIRILLDPGHAWNRYPSLKTLHQVTRFAAELKKRKLLLRALDLT